MGEQRTSCPAFPQLCYLGGFRDAFGCYSKEGWEEAWSLPWLLPFPPSSPPVLRKEWMAIGFSRGTEQTALLL